MRDQRTPAARPTHETITLADFTLWVGLDLEGTYTLLRQHNIRAAARPTTRISRDDAQRVRDLHWGGLVRQWEAEERAAPPQEDPEVARVRAALGDTSPPGLSKEDADVAALARQWIAESPVEPMRYPRRPRPTTRRPRPSG